MTDRSRYARRGVSAGKEDVHQAVSKVDKGLFPGAFCKIIPDMLGGDPEYCNIMHADGAGTKVITGICLLAGDRRHFSLERHSPRCRCDEP